MILGGILPALAQGPTVVTPANANPNPVSGLATTLTVLGADPAGQASLTYTWSANGPAQVSFSPNGSNSAQMTTATFQAAGSYAMQVLIQDPTGASITSNVAVAVTQTPATATITPPSASVVINATQQFAANILDQFGNALIPSPGPSLGWTDLSNTQLQSVCPPNFYQGQDYAFSTFCNEVINAWNSGIADTLRNRLIIWGGGHLNYFGNEIYSLNLNTSPPTLTRLNDPSPINTTDTCPAALADGNPNARETFNGLVYLANVDRMWVFNGGLACPNGLHDQDTWTLDMSTLQWQRMDPVNGSPTGVGVTYQIAAYDPNTQTVFMNYNGGLWQYNYATNSYAILNSNTAVPVGATGVIDPKRKLFIFIGSTLFGEDTAPHVLAVDISVGSTYVLQDWSSQVTGCTVLGEAEAPGLAYDPIQDRIVGYPGTGNAVYLFDPDTKTCVAQTFPNGPQNLTNNNGIYGRFQYFPALNAFATVTETDLDGMLLRLDSGTTGGPSWQVTGGGTVSSTGLFTAGNSPGGPFTLSAASGSAVGASSVTVSNPSGGLSTVFLLQGAATEVLGVTNGSVVTPTTAPAGFTGTVVANGSGSVNFAPSQVGTGVYFLNCCSNSNNAYFKFTGATIGNMFNATQGQITFYLESRETFAQREASGGTRYAFDVRDGNGTHLFDFNTQVSGGQLLFSSVVGGIVNDYFVPEGTEDTLFGNGVILQVGIVWNAYSTALYINNAPVSATTYTAPTPNWSAASNFDLGAYEYLSFGGYYISDDVINEFTVVSPPAVPDTTPPTVSLTSPLNGSTVSGPVTLSATATDNVGVASVQFQVDGVNFGAALTGAGPSYSIIWNTTTVGNGNHTIAAVATDTAGNTATTGSITVTVNNDTTPPVVTMTAPAPGGTVSGTVTVSANATDSAGVSSVQFQLDGANLGSPVTGAGPGYSVSWDTTTATNMTHMLTAVATDTVGNTATASAVTVMVNNPVVPPMISGVSAGSVTSSSSTITWTTDQASSSQVLYGLTSGYGSMSPLNSAPVTAHTVNLTGLAGSTTYHYQVQSQNAQGALSSSGDNTFTTPSGPQTLFEIQGTAGEVSGVTNGSVVTPTVTPGNFTGTVVANSGGSVNFAAGGNGVYFLNCCTNANNAYYQFTGAMIGNIFNLSQGQVTFNLQSRYSFAQREASASTARYAFDVRDGNGNHLFDFVTQVVSGGYLEFTYLAGGGGGYYYVPPGTENMLFGSGVTLQVTMSWNGTTANLYLNGTLVKSTPYTMPTASWTAASNFDLGAYQYLTFGGYDALDDVIGGFTVTGPAIVIDTTPPVVTMTAPAPGGTVSGTVTVSANATDSAGVSSVQFQLDGANLGSPVTGAGPGYSVSWDTTTATNMTHMLTAVATDTVGNTATASAVTVMVNNPVVPPMISGVSAGSVTSSSSTITWTTDQASSSQVLYGLTSGYGSMSPLNSAPVTAHTVNLTGLAGSTTYHYQVQSQNAQGALSSSGDNTFTTPSGPQTLFEIQGTAGEVSGVTNGSVVTPTVTPGNFTGTVVANSGGSVNFAAGGNGVYFLNCCTNANNAYYQFTGAMIGNIFNLSQGQVTFNLQSRYSFAQREASASTARYAFDVRDGNGNHLFDFVTQVVSGGYLEFTYLAGGGGGYYYVPPGTENMLFGSGVTLQVTMSWNGTTANLYLNGTLVKSTPYTMPTASWTAASNFDLGAYQYLTAGGYDALDDVIGGFTVTGPAIVIDTTPPVVTMTAPAPGGTVSGTVTVSANATDSAGVSSVQFQLDGANLGSPVTGAGPGYSVSWDTTTATNMTHMLTAVATDTVGNTATASAVTVMVNNPVVPPMISGVSAGSVTSSSSTITWTTDQASSSQVLYGLTSGYGSMSPLNSAPVTAHTVNLTGLAGSTTYHYQVQSQNAQGALSSSGDNTFTTPSGPQTLFEIQGTAGEVSGVTNGSVVTPTVTPGNFTGTVVANSGGSVNFAAGGNGVYFLNCCTNANNAYYQFTGAMIGNIFNLSQGQVTFNLQSRYSFAQREASASTARYAFDVRDGNGNHLFDFVTQVVSGGYLEFTYLAGGGGGYYYVPPGTENMLFGSGVTLQVTMSWNGTTANLYLNGTLVKSTPYTMPTASWTAASNFDLGAYQYLTFGGYDALDDVIGGFTVTGPAIQ